MRVALFCLAGVLGLVVGACGPSPAYDPDPVGHQVARPKLARGLRPFATPPARGGNSLVGKWVGVGTQNDGQTWLLEVNLRTLDGGTCANIKYPNQNCGGVWQCQASDGASLRATEQIMYGRETCVDQGTVDMHLTAEGTLVWSWVGDGISASSTLHRAAD